MIQVARTDWAMAQQVRVTGTLPVPSGSHTVTTVVSGGPTSTTDSSTVTGPATKTVDVEHFAVRGAAPVAANVAVFLDQNLVLSNAGTVAARPGYGSARLGTHISPHIYDHVTTMGLLPSGQTVVGLGIAWSTAQPAGPTWDPAQLAGYDTVFADLAARSCKAVVTCGTTPAWARSGGTTLTPATNPANHAGFIASIASRWAPTVIAVNPWNEPNLDSFWPGTDAQYVALVKAQKTAVAALGNGVHACLGPFSLNDYGYVDGLFALGLTGADFDAWEAHPYPFSTKVEPTGRWIDPTVMPSHLELDGAVVAGIHKIESVLASHGVTGKPIHVTELGVAYSPLDPDYYLRLSATDTAALLNGSIDAVRRIANVQSVIIHEAKDTTAAGGWASNFGLLDTANNRRSTWATLDALI
jgi:hypothetical protein